MPARDSHLDNAKGLLMVLVLTGHLVWPVPSPDRGTDVLYVLIYLFHMPLFALISGFLSHARFDPARLGSEAGKLLLPYALFVLIQWLLMRALGQEPFPITQGHFGLWFLLSLFCWRALLPLLARLPGAWAMILSLAVALACGFAPWIGLGFSLSRTLVLLPCFLAGHLLRRREFALSRFHNPARGALVLVALAVLCLPLAAWDIHPVLYSAHPYQALGLPPLWAPIIRLGRLVLALTGGLALLAVTPRGNTFLTAMGRRSLFIYLLHGPLLVLYRALPGLNDPLGRLWFVIPPLALGLAWLLSREAVVRSTRLLVTPLAQRPRPPAK